MLTLNPLKPLVTNFVKGMAHIIYPSLVPRKSFLKELLGGWRKKCCMVVHSNGSTLYHEKLFFRPSASQ